MPSEINPFDWPAYLDTVSVALQEQDLERGLLETVCIVGPMKSAIFYWDNFVREVH